MKNTLSPKTEVKNVEGMLKGQKLSQHSLIYSGAHVTLYATLLVSQTAGLFVCLLVGPLVGPLVGR